MKRRDFIAQLGGVAVVWPLATTAQEVAMPTSSRLDSQLSRAAAGAIQRMPW
jgi:hypothetical protein